MTDSDQDDDEEQKLRGAPSPIPLTPATGKQRALLALVITLGVLILLAFGVLVGGLVMGVGGKNAADNGKPWTYSVDVPAGARVVSAQVDGDRMLVHLSSPDGDDVVLIDTATGKVVGRIQVKPPR